MGFLCCVSAFIPAFISDYWQFWLVLAIFNAAFGVFMVEKALKSAERFLTAPDDLNAVMPAFIRPDKEAFKRSNFYPGCLFMCTPRIAWIFIWLFILGGVIWLFTPADHTSDRPIQGWRGKVISQTIVISCTMMLLNWGYVTKF